MHGTADIGDGLVPRWWTPLGDPEIFSPLIDMRKRDSLCTDWVWGF